MKGNLLKSIFSSTSVSRGLQVETEDLIQFSSGAADDDGAHAIQKAKEGESNNNVKKDIAAKLNQHRGLGKGAAAANNKGIVDDEEPFSSFYDDLSEFDSCDADELNASSRTADEQMDYLESLEPCPCYAKCCIDSVVTLFCVTLLG